MALIDGLPTVIGGVSSREFLQSIEVFDNSVDEAAPLGMDWRISAHALMHPVSHFSEVVRAEIRLRHQDK